ncbi:MULTISPECIES: D-alanyl-D-alanine carboxypeptidase family protein [unclassified Afipia]|uniref:D-alanyl-D-alanine carboxypeptidase family protein n=1 Tax=unclassified Afipia TaxID=2642050 RepID=UPI0006872A59|nr:MULTISPECIES: D-alanyl-D-alanine carboxypeptidase family protein [unclassified Afipia]
MLLAVIAPRVAQAEALLLIEADTGKVLQAENATYPWYPASVTKIMTAYVALKAVKDGRMTLDTLLTVSPTAAAQAPSKMGFRPGTQVTLDNALKMMMVKSANDIAVVIAEGVGGSIDGFSAEMNKTAQRLGMTQTSYVNPNGLPAEGQITSARDLGILARAIIRDLPEYEYFMHIPAIKFGRRVTANFNKLIGRYPGADGMKTGFICASGFNLVATATRNNKRLIAVVLGAQSSAQRAAKAAQLLERGFGGNKLSWLKPSLGTVDALAPIDASPPNLRDEMCGPKRKRPAAENEEDDPDIVADNNGGNDSGVSMFTAGLQGPTMKVSDLLAMPAAAATPVIVYTGPARTGAAILEADAAEAANQAASVAKRKKGAKAAKLAAKPEAEAAKKDAKPAAKPDAKPAAAAAKPKAAAVAPAAKPAGAPKADKKPDTAAKPAAAKPATAKPAAAKPAAASSAAKPAAAPAAKPAAKPAAQQKPDAAPRG